METQIFTVPNYNEAESDAAHFGVSLDNFIASWPSTGIEPFSYGQHGHSFVAERGSTVYMLPPRSLFYKAYENRYNPASSKQEETLKSYLIPDNVVDFASERNVDPKVIVKVGMQLLAWASRIDLPIGHSFYAVKDRSSNKKGKITAEFEFAISPINTVILQERQRHLLSKKSI